MTENCRVKIASRFGLTFPIPNLGTASSFPFSLTDVTSIYFFRSSEIATSLESATRTPPVTAP